MNSMTYMLKVLGGQNGISIERVTHETELRTSWESKVGDEGVWWNELVALCMGWDSKGSKRSQYEINSEWNGITHMLRVQVVPNGVSME